MSKSLDEVLAEDVSATGTAEPKTEGASPQEASPQEASPRDVTITYSEMAYTMGALILRAFGAEDPEQRRTFTQDEANELLFNAGARLAAADAVYGGGEDEEESDDEYDLDGDEVVVPGDADDVDEEGDEGDADDEGDVDDEDEEGEDERPPLRVKTRNLLAALVVQGVDAGWAAAKAENKSASASDIRAAQYDHIMAAAEEVFLLEGDEDDEDDEDDDEDGTSDADADADEN